MAFVVSSLHAAHEVVQYSIAPFVFLEVDSESVTEWLPVHQEDELLDHVVAVLGQNDLYRLAQEISLARGHKVYNGTIFK